MSKVTLIAKAQAVLAEAQALPIVVPPPPPPPPPSSALVALELEFASAGRQPWACGQTFKRGAVTGGVVADCADFQCIPWSYHDDGSVRDAHIAGYCDLSAAGRVTVRLSAGADARPPMPQPVPANVVVSVNGAPQAITARRVVAAGPVMYHEQVVCRVDQQVANVYEVRHFVGGGKEVLTPCVENCGFLATSQPNRVLSLTVEVGGIVRFAESVNVKHHTRIPLLRGSTWSYWLGAGGVLPYHDRAYLCSSESFPPYSPTAASAATLAPLPSSYLPNYVGEGGPTMGQTGYNPRIGVLARHNVYPLTTGGRKAWDYMHAEAFAVGSWSVHLRDEQTGAPPLPSAYPTHTWQSTLPKGSGGENGAVDLAHQPSSVYTAAKLTGWRWFVDEHLYWATFNHFYQQPPVRQNEKGILRTDAGTNQDRGAAWALRTVAQAIALTGPADPLHAEFVRIWRENMAYYKARLAAPPYANNLGIVAPYSSSGTSLYAGGDRGRSTAWWGSGWMQAFFCAALGHALQLRLPGTVHADTDAVFQFSAKWIVGLVGPTHWRRFAVYAAPWWANGMQTTPGTWYASHAEMWAEYEYGHSLTTLDPAPGGTIKQHASNVDITGADWDTGRQSFYWPALVYAVMHNAPGAAAGFARIQSSASFPAIASGIQNPIWTSMMPPGVRHPGA